MDFEEDTYTAIFSALKHPIRRKILRMLEMAPATYTEMMNALGIETGLLNYHLESLSALLAKNDEGKYKLSEFGEAALSLTRRVEEPASGRGAPGESAARRMTLVLIMGLLIVGVALTSYSLADTDVQLVKGYETIDHGNSWYPPNGLYGLELWTDRPGTLMNFWWSMNTTVDIYVMSREQYRAQKDMGGPPDQYLRRHVGSEGNITVMTESGSIDYEFAMYTGDSGAWEEAHGLSVYRWKPVKRIDYTLLALDGLLILSAVFLTALETPIVSRLGGALPRRRDSSTR
ncbi:MAG: winged helix-turn-helix domain-containing protein [Candidatus Bathyarchaeota archaeon]|nr:winged helix-turn-helix domain-containing protein [Candidatus Bathyarchaeota archaeon]